MTKLVVTEEAVDAAMQKLQGSGIFYNSEGDMRALVRSMVEAALA